MNTQAPRPRRLRMAVQGAVQGVGFRPFVFRLARDLRLAGWVNNSGQGVLIEAEGPKDVLESFLARLESERPPRSFIQSLEASWLDTIGYADFEIRASEASGVTTAFVLPDIATCPDCLADVFDPRNRRYQYPFTNCTNCGPRFTIIESLPYDRPNTSMRDFVMCARCRAEYHDPGDRRFHAQPNACPICGPHLELWDADGKLQAGRAPREETSEQDANRPNVEALKAAAEAIARGSIVAVKGLGGFHLMVAAHDETAVQRLRRRKHREEKPLALMFPTLDSVRGGCELSSIEERVLRSPEAPILLVRRFPAGLTATRGPAPLVAPGNPYLGVMLPYTPLHHLLLGLLGFPVVATSGNLSDEPICTDEHEAVTRLAGIADLFLVHNRPIVRHVDDSIVRIMAGRELVLRRARGFAPLPVTVPEIGPAQGEEPVLAVGAHLKNSVALRVGKNVFISQHIGDLETEQAFAAFERVTDDLQELYASRPGIVAADLHPDYLSTRRARELTATANGPRLVSVQHHLAHVFSCMADNDLAPPVLGVSWDGTGYGLDGTVWGGEFFVVRAREWRHFAQLRQFRLAGGDKAVKEPRRSCLGLLYEAFGEKAFGMRQLTPLASFSEAELGSLRTMLERQLNAPLTSSVGRLFDAVAALLGLRQKVRFEGQAAMELEFALGGVHSNEAYPISLLGGAGTPPSVGKQKTPESGAPSCGTLQLDWLPMLSAILEDIEARTAPGIVSARFHNALVETIVATATKASVERVVLSGGCFQNRYLTERAIVRLEAAGFRPYWHQRVPPNDGGIALGQVVAALARLEPT